MESVVYDDGWRLSDELWAQIAPLLPPRRAHPLGCHRPRIPDRVAMNAILLVLRARCPWQSLDATGLCCYSSAYRRFREWTAAGVFGEMHRRGLLEVAREWNVDWAWLDGVASPEREAPAPRRHRRTPPRIGRVHHGAARAALEPAAPRLG